MKTLEMAFMQGFIRMADDGFRMGWHERNGGNLSYRIKPEEVALIKGRLRHDAPWVPIGAHVPSLAGEYFLVTGSGKFFRDIKDDPEGTLAIIEIDDKGENYQIKWGLVEGGKPTSELPAHLMNHAVKRAKSEDYRVIYHAHPANIIALTFVLPLKDEVFTRELWEMATECPVVFPDGVGVVGWMVPGGEAIAIETSKLMERYDAVIWAHHGIFCAGDGAHTTFGLMHTIEKSAEILVKVLSMSPAKLQTIEPDNFRDLAGAFHVSLPERFLYEKESNTIIGKE
ncbi:MAG: rhamnulose-1-phosphate aldolase [Butyrivibrio sp.]|nr:rhamnulose-1-phosphate aldolase [Butyrivibrio sp.]